MNEEVVYFVKANKEKGFSSYLVKVWGWESQAGASVYQRQAWSGGYNPDGTLNEDGAKLSDFDEHSEVSVGKDWDGSMRMNVKTDGSSPKGAEVGFMLNLAAFFCDQRMGAEATISGLCDTLEESLGHLNLGDGADENPGITFELFKEN